LDTGTSNDNFPDGDFQYSDIALTGDADDWSDLRVIFLHLKDTYDFLRKSGLNPADFPEVAKRLDELLAAYRPAGRTATKPKSANTGTFRVPSALQRLRPHTRTDFAAELLENDEEFKTAEQMVNAYKYRKRKGAVALSTAEEEEVRRANRFVQAARRYRKQAGPAAA
jgi:hypothetical protein